MTRVKLGGKELTIADEQVAEYLANGYSVIDSHGNILLRGNVLTFEEAIVENDRLNKENKALENEIAMLKLRLGKEACNVNEPVVEATKKRTRKPKSEE